MKPQDYQDAIYENEPCAHLPTILKYICLKYKLSRQDFMVLLEIHKEKEFTWNDFATAELTASWDKRRFYRWKADGLVELYRAKDGKYRMYNIYRCTRKTKNMVREFYRYISGEQPVPTMAFSKNATYTSNRLARKINIQNENNGTP